MSVLCCEIHFDWSGFPSYFHDQIIDHIRKEILGSGISTNLLVFAPEKMLNCLLGHRAKETEKTPRITTFGSRFCFREKASLKSTAVTVCFSLSCVKYLETAHLKKLTTKTLSQFCYPCSLQQPKALCFKSLIFRQQDVKTMSTELTKIIENPLERSVFFFSPFWSCLLTANGCWQILSVHGDKLYSIWSCPVFALHCIYQE